MNGSIIFACIGVFMMLYRKPRILDQYLAFAVCVIALALGFGFSALLWGGIQRYLLNFIAIIKKEGKLGLINLFKLFFLIMITLEGLHLIQYSPKAKILLLLVSAITALTYLGFKAYDALNTKLTKNKIAATKENNSQINSDSVVIDGQAKEIKAEILEEITPSPFAQYTLAADHLVTSAASLPSNLKPHVQAIVNETKEIVRDLEKDINDISTAEKFLNRYLPATQTIIEKCNNLNAASSKNNNIVAALAESELLLIKIARSFEKLRSDLLENDRQDLVVEMRLIDNLLKMDGAYEKPKLEDHYATIESLKLQAYRTSEQLGQQVSEICNLAEQMLGKVQKNERGIYMVDQFLKHYLQLIQNTLERYPSASKKEDLELGLNKIRADFRIKLFELLTLK